MGSFLKLIQTVEELMDYKDTMVQRCAKDRKFLV